MLWAIPNGIRAAACTTVCWFWAWGFLYFQAANGLHESARSANSLRALIHTLGTGGTAILLGAIMPLAVAFCFFSPIRGAGATFAVGVLLLGLVALICALLFARAEFMLVQAENRIAEQERIVQSRSILTICPPR